MAQNESVDVVLVGAGIMSATLAVLLKELDPTLKLEVVEAMDSGAAESSNPWNNAGTGHAGLCELNYTPQAADGSIDIKKAVHINTQFEVSRQFWAYLTKKGNFGSARAFINPVPHLSYVEGDKGVSFLKKRFELLKQHHAFAEMEYTEDKAVMNDWMPLMMPGRPADQHIAATRVAKGTDVNFGALTNKLLKLLGDSPDAQVKYSKKVVGLLQLSGIPESKGFGGFPVSGQWLRCDNPEIVKQHQAKVYSQAAVGAPPMSVPHLDTRVVDGKTSLLFGPYAGFTTKFLKHGSLMDLPLSVRMGNIGPMLAVARDNMDLTKYLVSEVMQSMEQRLEALRRFYPQAKAEDWRLEVAGQRVQIIKKDPKKGGVLQFGTELVSAQDGSLAALLGASPGASVTVSIMLELIERCFPEQAKGAWAAKLKEIFPAREKTLATDAALYHKISADNDAALDLAESSPAAKHYA